MLLRRGRRSVGARASRSVREPWGGWSRSRRAPPGAGPPTHTLRARAGPPSRARSALRPSTGLFSRTRNRVPALRRVVTKKKRPPVQSHGGRALDLCARREAREHEGRASRKMSHGGSAVEANGDEDLRAGRPRGSATRAARRALQRSTMVKRAAALPGAGPARGARRSESRELAVWLRRVRGRRSIAGGMPVLRRFSTRHWEQRALEARRARRQSHSQRERAGSPACVAGPIARSSLL